MSDFKSNQKRKIFFNFLFLFLVLLFFKPNPVLGLACSQYEEKFKKATEKFLPCSEEEPVEVLGQILQRETNCGQLALSIPSVNRCKEYREKLCQKEKFKGYFWCKPEARERDCNNLHNTWATVCAKVRNKLVYQLTQEDKEYCKTSGDYGMGPAQFQPTTWQWQTENYYKNFGRAKVLDPWNMEDAILVKGFYLSTLGYCTDPFSAVMKYNGKGAAARQYAKEIFEAIKKFVNNVGEKVKRIYEDTLKRLKELWEYERELEIEYPEIFGLKPKTLKTTTLTDYIQYIFNLSVAIIGLILFGALVRGGVLYLISTGDVGKLKEAREQISSAFFGAIFLLAGYIILTTINPGLGIPELPILEKPKIEESPVYQPSYPPEKKTAIYWEISMGQMLEEGLWEKERTNKLNSTLGLFEQSLIEEIKVNQTFNRISDLNRYLKTLTEDCHCEELTGICQKAKNFAFPVGCVGDPCEKVRDKINDVLKINKKKLEEISAYKEKLIEWKDIFEEEGRKFRKLKEVILENCKEKGLLSRTEYYRQTAFIEAQGGTTELESIYKTAGDDPLVFYCPVGGTIFDEPYLPDLFPKDEEIILTEPLSCPIVIPSGEVIDKVSGISYEVNSNLEDLIYYIDKFLAGLTEMTGLVSQCNESRCDVNCSCVPNPCFEPACGIPPARVNKCGIGRCTPPTPLTPNFCYFFCDSPCLQAVGGCYGEPCPRQKIIETVEKIKIYEDEIFKLVDGIKGSIEDVKLYLETEEDEINLNKIRRAAQTCLKYSAEIDITETPSWKLVNCEAAIGNKGPDGEITTCHPQDVYCCSVKQSESLAEMPSGEKPVISTSLPGGPYSPSAYGYNKVPYFSQYDERWKDKSFDCGTTIGQAGSGPASIAMVLNFFGAKFDPASIADWVLENNYRSCREEQEKIPPYCQAVETFGKKEGIKCNFQKDIGAVLNEIRDSKNKVAVINVRGAPPYATGGHHLVLTGIEKEWNEEFVYYNDPAYDPLRPERRPAQGRKPIDWFEKQGIGAGYVIYK